MGDGINTGVDAVEDAYETSKEGVEEAWQTVKQAVKDQLVDKGLEVSLALPKSMEFNYNFKTEKVYQRQIGIGGHNWLVCDECHLHLGAAVDLHMKFSNAGIPKYIRAGIRAMAGGNCFSSL